MEKHSVVPDIIPVGPIEILKVTYQGGEIKVDLGNVLTPTQVKDKPKVEWSADPDSFYTLCLIDPDNKCKGATWKGEWLHWLVVNIPGKNVEKGIELAEFLGSGPPKGTGLHRYIFLVYNQNRKIVFHDPKIPNTTADGRANFSIADFSKKYKFAEPAAGNLYRAEWDESVIAFYERLKKN